MLFAMDIISITTPVLNKTKTWRLTAMVVPGRFSVLEALQNCLLCTGGFSFVSGVGVTIARGCSLSSRHVTVFWGRNLTAKC